MDKKEFLKKYLKAVVILFCSLFILSLILVFGISASNISNVDWMIVEKILVAVGCAYLPCASFSGFCMCFYRFNNADKKAKLMLTVFFPVTLAVVTVVGCVCLVPFAVYSFCYCIKNK